MQATGVGSRASTSLPRIRRLGLGTAHGTLWRPSWFEALLWFESGYTPHASQVNRQRNIFIVILVIHSSSFT
jgi:hypothetical protein